MESNEADFPMKWAKELEQKLLWYGEHAYFGFRLKSPNQTSVLDTNVATI